MKLYFLVFFVCLVASSSGNHDLLVRHRRQINFMGNTQLLFQELVQKLENTAQEALDATQKFNEGLQEQAKLFAEKVAEDLKGLRERVNNAIISFNNRFKDAGTTVQTCMETFRKKVDGIYLKTVENSKDCADERIEEIANMIDSLRQFSFNATEFATNAVEELKNCRDNINSGFLATGSCLGSVAVRTEFYGAVHLAQSGLMITRINLALATLPAALEVCAGTHLVAAGIDSAKYVVEIATCSASSAFSSLAGNLS